VGVDTPKRPLNLAIPYAPTLLVGENICHSELFNDINGLTTFYDTKKSYVHRNGAE
jgi:hypothetical protein